jgi:hypothetical protein
MGRRPATFHESSGNAGGLAAGDLPGFPKLRGGLSTLTSGFFFLMSPFFCLLPSVF